MTWADRLDAMDDDEFEAWIAMHGWRDKANELGAKRLLGEHVDSLESRHKRSKPMPAYRRRFA